MRDIKIVKSNKIVEKPSKVITSSHQPENKMGFEKQPVPLQQEQCVESDQNFVTGSKRSFSLVSTILFGLMSLSIVCYIFIVSSSIYYAVQTNQFTFKSEKVYTASLTIFDKDKLGVGASSGRISYINKDSDTSISLK